MYNILVCVYMLQLEGLIKISTLLSLATLELESYSRPGQSNNLRMKCATVLLRLHSYLLRCYIANYDVQTFRQVQHLLSTAGTGSVLNLEDVLDSTNGAIRQVAETLLDTL
jgi:hypothetical protein